MCLYFTTLEVFLAATSMTVSSEKSIFQKDKSHFFLKLDQWNPALLFLNSLLLLIEDNYCSVND